MQPLSLSSFQVLTRLLTIGKHGLHRISFLVGNARWSPGSHRTKTQIPFLFKHRKRVLFLFSFYKEKKPSSSIKENREEPSSSNTISTL
jgi:hypothetical protein